MNVIEFQTPAPSCLVPVTHPARAVTPAIKTNVSKTIKEHDLSLLDDYDLTDRLYQVECQGDQ